MSLLLNALKKAEEGENKDGQTPASESGAQAPEAAASAPPAVAPPASTPPTPSAPPVAAASGAAAAAPDSSAAPGAPAARPGGLTGGGLSLKKGPESSAPPPLEKPGAMPTPATAAAGRMAGPAGIGGGMGLKKTVTPAAAHQAAAAAAEGGGGPDLVVDDDSARSAASRIFRGGGGGGGGSDAEEDDDSPRFRGLRNFLMAAAFLAAIGGGGYFTLEAGLIPGVSTQSVLQLVGLQPPPPPPVASRQSFPELNVADGAVLRLPRPAIDVQSEIDFTDLPEARIGSEDREEYVQRIAVLTGYNAAREAQLARERGEQQEQLAASLAEFGDGDLAGLVVEQGEGAADAQTPAGREPLSDEIFTAEESRSEKARIEALTPSEDDIKIISASEKIALAMAAEEMAAEGDAAAEEMPAGEGDAVAQAEEGQPAEGGSEEGAADEAGESPKPEKAPAKETKPLQPKETMVAPSLKGEERRVALERAKGFYLAGRLDAAEAAYRAILRRDANNVDAMRGIAQVATSSGRRQLATTMYSQILALYPKDPIAIAELANLQDSADPAAVERRIRAVIGDQPEADARLYFSLGNLYAARSMWTKAQEVYFEAVALEPDNPDYAYNLAVVLDYLNKPGLAARYYRQAVNLAEKSPSGFNLPRVRARIQDLEQ